MVSSSTVAEGIDANVIPKELDDEALMSKEVSKHNILQHMYIGSETVLD